MKPAENTIVLKISGAKVEFIEYITGGIVLDMQNKEPDQLNEYLFKATIKSITLKDAETPVSDIVKAIREMHAKDYKEIDLHIASLLEELRDPEVGKK